MYLRFLVGINKNKFLNLVESIFCPSVPLSVTLGCWLLGPAGVVAPLALAAPVPLPLSLSLPTVTAAGWVLSLSLSFSSQEVIMCPFYHGDLLQCEV